MNSSLEDLGLGWDDYSVTKCRSPSVSGLGDAAERGSFCSRARCSKSLLDLEPEKVELLRFVLPCAFAVVPQIS